MNAMNDWVSENLFGLISLLFGAGSIGYAVISKVLDRQKYLQEVRDKAAEADIKGDEFWKNRYDVLQKEVESKDTWWKARYDALHSEYEKERKMSNEIVKSFRNELNEMRKEYDEQRGLERRKYDALKAQYRSFEEDSIRKETEYKQRICQLEDLVSKYERRLRDDE